MKTLANIRIKHLKTLETYAYNMHVCATSRSDFPTSRYNICTIHLEQIKHLEDTLEKSYVYGHYKMCNILIYFCNIDIQHLQHTSETLKTYSCNMRFSPYFCMTQHRAGGQPILEICILATIIHSRCWGESPLLGESPLPSLVCITIGDCRRGRQRTGRHGEIEGKADWSWLLARAAANEGRKRAGHDAEWKPHTSVSEHDGEGRSRATTLKGGGEGG
jgi:hypothetical protein